MAWIPSVCCEHVVNMSSVSFSCQIFLSFDPPLRGPMWQHRCSPGVWASLAVGLTVGVVERQGWPLVLEQFFYFFRKVLAISLTAWKSTLTVYIYIYIYILILQFKGVLTCCTPLFHHWLWTFLPLGARQVGESPATVAQSQEEGGPGGGIAPTLPLRNGIVGLSENRAPIITIITNGNNHGNSDFVGYLWL